MTRALLAVLLFFYLESCNYTSTTEKTGDVFVNQGLLESSIRLVQPAGRIEFGIKTTNNHDSVLIVKVEVNPKIPDDSLNEDRAKMIISSFIAILPNLKTFTSCQVFFIREKQGALISTDRAIAYFFPMSSELKSEVENYKDTARASMGYLDTGWVYVNKELHLSLPLKNDWYYASLENDSFVYYAIGSAMSELPQYRTDQDRKVTFRTLRDQAPGDAYPLLRLTKLQNTLSDKKKYPGPMILLGIVKAPFESEDEYLKALYAILYPRKNSSPDIQTYRYGSVSFRGLVFRNKLKNGETVNVISAIKYFPRVTLVLNINYATPKELEEIKNELSGLRFD